MKTPLFVKCECCGEDNYINYVLNDTKVKSTCKCGKRFSYSLASAFTLGARILERSKYEFIINEDYNLSIVFSAMALECELSNLYFIWMSIGKNINNAELEELLRKLNNIKQKMQEVSNLLYEGGIVDFIKDHVETANRIDQDFPSLDRNNLIESFQQVLFWPRNRILHLGFSEYNIDDAQRCLNVAQLGLDIFNDMHKKKSQLF